MTDYASDSVVLSYRTTDALDDSEVARTFSSAPSSPAITWHRKPIAKLAGSNLDFTSTFTTVSALYVWNRDATNFVTLQYTCASNGSIQSIKIPAGQWVKLVDVSNGSAKPVLTADTATCKCEVFAVGL